MKRGERRVVAARDLVVERGEVWMVQRGREGIVVLPVDGLERFWSGGWNDDGRWCGKVVGAPPES
jgi:hypothetical protein